MAKKHAHEIILENSLSKAEQIIDDNYLKTSDARKLLDCCYRILQEFQRIKKKKKKWEDKYQKIKNES